jgi:hypothetical protein
MEDKERCNKRGIWTELDKDKDNNYSDKPRDQGN